MLHKTHIHVYHMCSSGPRQAPIVTLPKNPPGGSGRLRAAVGGGSRAPKKKPSSLPGVNIPSQPSGKSIKDLTRGEQRMVTCTNRGNICNWNMLTYNQPLLFLYWYNCPPKFLWVAPGGYGRLRAAPGGPPQKSPKILWAAPGGSGRTPHL